MDDDGNHTFLTDSSERTSVILAVSSEDVAYGFTLTKFGNHLDNTKKYCYRESCKNLKQDPLSLASFQTQLMPNYKRTSSLSGSNIYNNGVFQSLIWAAYKRLFLAILLSSHGATSRLKISCSGRDNSKYAHLSPTLFKCFFDTCIHQTGVFGCVWQWRESVSLWGSVCPCRIYLLLRSSAQRDPSVLYMSSVAAARPETHSASGSFTGLLMFSVVALGVARLGLKSI